MENLYSKPTQTGHFSMGVCNLSRLETQVFLSKQKSCNNDIISEIAQEVDRKRKCRTCKSLLFVGFEFCTECGDENPTIK